MSASISTARKNSSTELTIVGTLEEVYEEIKRVFREYHPDGYGTQVEKIRYSGRDNYEARIWHANSAG